MKTDFFVVWVDDNRPFVEAIEMELKSWLDTKGFESRVLMHKDEIDVLKDVHNNEVELIIIDYKLPKKNGDVLIDEIRNSGCYQDIVFYSEARLPEKRFDGVFYVSKEDALARIKELIELKLRRSSDPASVRGWIVADAIELEIMVADLLLRCFTEKAGFTFSERLLGHNGPLEFWAKYKLLSGILKDLIDSLKLEEPRDVPLLKQIEACKSTLDKFNTEVVEVRNAFAHQRVEEFALGKVIRKKTKDADEIVLNETTFTQIRKDLRKHRDNLIALQAFIQ